MADVPQIPVTAVAVRCVEGKIDAMCVDIGDLVFTGLHFPYVRHSPGSNDPDVGSKGLDAQLKTDLIVALSGSTVADGGCVFLAGDLNETLGNGWTRHGCAKEIFVLVDRSGLYAGHDVFITEFVDDVFNI